MKAVVTQAEFLARVKYKDPDLDGPGPYTVGVCFRTKWGTVEMAHTFTKLKVSESGLYMRHYIMWKRDTLVAALFKQLTDAEFIVPLPDMPIWGGRLQSYDD